MNNSTIQSAKTCCKCHDAPRVSGSYCHACARIQRNERKERKAAGIIKPRAPMGGECSNCGGPKPASSSWCHGCNQAASNAKRRALGVPQRLHLRPSDRFWARINKNGRVVRPELGQCWEWTGYCGERGYGQFHLTHERPVGAHVFSLELESGTPVPDGMQVNHKCDNPPCCNPAHLFIGTQLDNMRDKVAKNRQARGEDHGSSILNKDMVHIIRTRHASGDSPTTIARDLGVSSNAVWRCATRQTWKHIP